MAQKSQNLWLAATAAMRQKAGLLLANQVGSGLAVGFDISRPNGWFEYWDDQNGVAQPVIGVDATGATVFNNANGLVFNGPVSNVGAAGNYIATETGANNAIAGALPAAVVLAAGLTVKILLAHSLQAGANTFALTGGSAKAIKSHFNPATNLATAYVVGGIITLTYDGTVWQDQSQ